MEVTAPCITLVVNMLLLLTARAQSSYDAGGAYPHIDPNRLQFFDNEPISFSCAGFRGPAGWRVMTRAASGSAQWDTSTGSLDIKPAFVSHSGEYWCENGDGARSSSLNITITAGDVILESPALPVTEGDAISLRCRKGGHPSNFLAYFYKDGRFVKTGYEGEMIIDSVSKSDEGLYKCSISGSQGDSPESWMVVSVLPVLLLGADSQHSYGEDVDAGLAWIIPTRLQLFDYGSVSFHCEGPNTTAGWRVLRRIMGEVSPCVSNWETTRPTVCAVKPVYTTDSGEYWCETGDGQRSNTVNITVTAGDVILDSPVLPVVEGDAATLRCRSKKTSSAHVANFYKDGPGTGSFGEMTIARVSKAHEGFYKCSISDYGVSPESWLAVRAAHRDAPASSSSSSSCHVYLISRTVFTILMVALLLLLVGLLHCGKLPKHRVGSPRQ